MTRSIPTNGFKEHVLDSERPVVVDFYADWCAPCKTMAHVVEQLSAEWEGWVDFVKVDIEADPRLARAYNISTIPSLLLFEDGEVEAWSTGAKPGYIVERELGLRKGPERTMIPSGRGRASSIAGGGRRRGRRGISLPARDELRIREKPMRGARYAE